MDLNSLIEGVDSLPVDGLIADAIKFFLANSVDIFLVTLGIGFYGFIIWNFYHNISRRDIFESKVIKATRKRLGTGQAILKTLLRFFEYGVLFPAISFIWFVLLALMLFLLAKTQPVANILLLSISVISAARISAYYSEKLSEDIAKLLPLALLGVFLVEPTFFSVGLLIERVYEILSILPMTLGYILYLAVLEWLLRILLFIKTLIFGDRKAEEMFKRTALDNDAAEGRKADEIEKMEIERQLRRAVEKQR